MTPTARRSQAERTAETTRKLLEATVDCLHDLGWAGTSTTEVCRRAGVSRGALLHHYPTRHELVAAAVGFVLDRRVEEFRAAMATLPADAPVVDRLETAIDVLWGIFQSPTVTAWIEMTVASRTDDDLREVVVRTQEGLAAAIADAWRELFPTGDGLPLGFYDIAPKFLLSVLDGLTVHRMTGDPEWATRAEEVLLANKLIVRVLADTDLEVLARHLAELLGEQP